MKQQWTNDMLTILILNLNSHLRTIKASCWWRKQRQRETISIYKPAESSKSGFQTSRLNTNTDTLRENINQVCKHNMSHVMFKYKAYTYYIYAYLLIWLLYSNVYTVWDMQIRKTKYLTITHQRLYFWSQF